MYSIKKVSELLNIPVVTIRAWENRYGIITPSRTDGGHRLYSDADIETLQWLKSQMNDKGIKISEAVHLLNQSMAPVNHTVTPDTSSATLNNYDGFIDQLYESLTDLDSERANEVIDLAFSLFSFEMVFHHILAPVLYRIGEQWETGQVSVAQEHFASELILSRFHQVMRILPVRPRTPRALALCPEGEHHQIGLMLFCLFLRNKGLEVIYLGANTPYHGLTDIITKKAISVVVISITSPRLSVTLEQWVKSCKDQFPSIHFVLGGNGMKPCPESLSSYVLYEGYDEWENWFAGDLK